MAKIALSCLPTGEKHAPSRQFLQMVVAPAHEHLVTHHPEVSSNYLYFMSNLYVSLRTLITGIISRESDGQH